MIDYGEGAKRTIFKDKNNKLYSRIENQDKEVNFVEIYRMPKDFIDACLNYPFDRETINYLSNIPQFPTQFDLDFAPKMILDLNIKLLKLQESAAFFMRVLPSPGIKSEISKALYDVQNKVEILTKAWAKVWEHNPQFYYSYRSGLFSIPGVITKILDGENTFKDAYGTVERSNHNAFEALKIREFLGGKDYFSVSELSRIANMGLEKNQMLEEQYQDEKENY